MKSGLLVVSCGLGTQHLARPDIGQTLCGREWEYETGTKFNETIDCQVCKRVAKTVSGSNFPKSL